MRRGIWLLLLVAGEAGAQNDFRFAIIGDRTGSAVAGVYERVWREVDRAHPDFVINVGDSIEGGDDATAERQWSAFRDIIAPYKRYPFYYTPGNHDIWSDFSHRLFERATGRPAYYSFDYQDAHFTVLDNSQTEGLSDQQMAFLARDLEQNKNRAPKFVFLHNPFWLLPLKFQSGEFPLHKLVTRYRVNYVISGHTHQFAAMERDGVVYMVVGSSGGHFRGLETGDRFADGWFYQYVLGGVKGRAVEFTIQELGSPFGKERSFKAEETFTKAGK